MFSLQTKVGQPPEILVSLGSDEQGQKLQGLVLKARNIHLPSSSSSNGKGYDIHRTDPADVTTMYVCMGYDMRSYKVPMKNLF